MSELAQQVMDNLPILQVVLPLLAAPACVVVHHKRYTWWVALGVTWISLATSIELLRTVLRDGVLSYAVGGWPAPWGIELRIEPINAFLLVLVSGISAVVLLAAPRGFDRDIPHDRHHLAYAAYLLCMTGLLGMSSAGDAFNIFVFLEISSLSSYGLIALGRSRRALTAAFRYLILGTLGGTFLLLGIGMMYMVTGTLNLADLSQRLPAAAGTYDRVVMLSMVCILLGAGIKLALVPLHGWLPDAYTFAPAVVTAFLAATATKVAYYVLVRFLFRAFGADLAFGRFQVDRILLPLALVAMVLGAVLAIYEKDVKRLLAFSSISQIGYMVLGLSLVSVDGLTGGIVHLMNHAVTKSGLFLVIACVVHRLGSSHIDAFHGLGQRMPFTAAAFVVGGLGMIGVPATAGFVSKWYLVLAAVAADRWLVAAMLLFSSLLAIVYVWKVVEIMYFRPPKKLPTEEVGGEGVPWSMLGPAWMLLAASVVFGLWTSPTVGVARRAALALLGASDLGGTP